MAVQVVYGGGGQHSSKMRRASVSVTTQILRCASFAYVQTCGYVFAGDGHVPGWVPTRFNTHQLLTTVPYYRVRARLAMSSNPRRCNFGFLYGFTPISMT